MKTLASQLLTQQGLKAEDAARLCLECIEALGEEARSKPHDELMELLRSILREGIYHWKERNLSISFEEAVQGSLAERRGRRPCTLRDLRHYTRHFLKHRKFASTSLRQLSSKDCRELLEKEFQGSSHNFRKARAIMHSIFAYGFRHEYCDRNPVDRIENPRIQEAEILPLSIAEIRRLQDCARKPAYAAMRLPLHLMLYCGVRPTELQRMNTDDIDWQSLCVRIRPQSSKTGGGRVIPLRGLKHIQDLRPAGAERKAAPRPIAPQFWDKSWRELRQAAGFRLWTKDSLRHSFASYHAYYFRNLPALQLEMGHGSLALLRSRYINARHIRPKDAKLFWEGD